MVVLGRNWGSSNGCCTEGILRWAPLRFEPVPQRAWIARFSLSLPAITNAMMCSVAWTIGSSSPNQKYSVQGRVRQRRRANPR
jgi:hypothetical protein